MKAQFENKQQAEQVIRLALGRILSIGSRPFQNGDIEEYDKCKWLIMDAGEYLGIPTENKETSSYQYNYYKIQKD